MAKRHVRHAPVYEYVPFYVTGAATTAPVGNQVATTSSTAVAAPGSVTITPGSMANIYVNMLLNISGGTGTAEDVVVSAVTSTTFTATFANTHSGTYNITSYKATFIRGITINQVGTTPEIILYKGNPNAKYPGTSTTIGVAFADLKPTAVGFIDYPGVIDGGLYYTSSGTGINMTIWYADEY